MSESEAASTQADLDALKALQADAPELERIENLLDRFNVFEAIGFVGQEVKHSHFLAFLLDPSRNHGLGDRFLKRLLREAVASAVKPSVLPVSEEDLNVMDLGRTLVRREHQHIDILLTNETHKLVVIIENKIWTAERSDQLARYYRIVKDTYPGWRILGIYLAPFGGLPSHEAYLPLGYERVCRAIDNVLEDRTTSLQPELRMSLTHYVQMLRRNVLGDSELARLCNQVYSKHRKALDLIYEHRFFHQEQVRNTVIALIEASPSLIHDYLNTKYPNEFIGFRLRAYDTPALRVAQGWGGFAKTGYILRFVVGNYPDNVKLALQVGPGDEEVRRRLLMMAHNNPSVFENALATPNRTLMDLFVRPILSSDFYEGASYEEREQEICRQWNMFLEEDLPRIEAALNKETWIWESVEPAEGPTDRSSRFGWEEGDIVITKWPEHED